MCFSWYDNILVNGKDLYTVLPDGTLEIRGPGWDRRRRRGDTPMTDRSRVCRCGSPEKAKRIAELVVQLENTHSQKETQ